MFTELITATDKLAGTIVGIYGHWKAMQLDSEVKLRLAYIELRRNVSLIDSLTLETESAQSTVAMRLAIPMLSCEVLDMIFSDGMQNGKLAKTFKALCQTSELDDEPNPHAVDIAVALSVAVRTLQSIAMIDPTTEGLKQIHLRTRLLNIEQRCVELLKLLHNALNPDS